MANCLGCGGTVGLDCFNPAECFEVSNRINSESTQEADFLRSYVDVLEHQISVLKEILTHNNIFIPDFKKIETKEEPESKIFDPLLPF